MPSHAGDNVVGSCWQRHCWCDLAVTRCRCRVMVVTILSSHAGDGAARVTWQHHDVDAESC
jgi:hypothetical protein